MSLLRSGGAIILARIVFTEDAVWGSDPFHENLRASLVVVQLLLFLRQRRYRRLGEAALDEPVRRARREHEELLHPVGARLGLDVPQQALPIALVAMIRPNREAGELARTGAQERVERRTADDDPIVFDDGKARDLALEQLAPPAYERSVLLERLDQLQNSARVVDRGGTQFHHLVRSDHRARALVREKLDQQGTWEFTADDMGALHASADRLDRMRQIEPGVRRESVAAREQLGSLLRGQLGEKIAMLPASRQPEIAWASTLRTEPVY